MRIKETCPALLAVLKPLSCTHFPYLLLPLSPLLTSCQLGDLDGGAGVRVRRGGGVGGDADLLLVEKALPVSLVLQLLPCRFRPGMELCCFLSGSLSFLLECLGLGDLE